MSLAELERYATQLCLGPAPSEGALAELGDARIWRLYRDMVRNRLRGELRFALRRSVAALGDALFDRLVRALFSQRRKTLSNAMKRFDPTGPAVLALAGIDGQRRPETLQVQEIARLTELLAAVRRPAG